MNPKVLIRHSPPGKLDHAPRGTVCKVFYPMSEQFDLWKQFGSNESSPDWQMLGVYFSDDALDSHIIEKVKE